MQTNSLSESLLDKRTNRHMDSWKQMDRQTNELSDKQTDELKNKWTDGPTNVRTNDHAHYLSSMSIPINIHLGSILDKLGS